MRYYDFFNMRTTQNHYEGTSEQDEKTNDREEQLTAPSECLLIQNTSFRAPNT